MSQISTDYRALAGTERTPRAGAKRTGPENLSEILTVSVRIRRRSDAPPLPDLTRPGRRYPSRKQFAALYGASQEDIAAIAAFAAANGLEVLESSIARRTVILKGTVGQMNTAFAVDLGRYETADEKYRGREGPVHVPAAIADIVEGVFGLDNRKMAQRHVRTNSSVTCTAGTAPLLPAQVAQLYDFPAQPATGQTIALLEFEGGFTPQAVNAYFKSVGMAPPSIATVSVNGAPSTTHGHGAAETFADICVAGSIAPEARLAVYLSEETQQGWMDAVAAAVHDDALSPSIISISYGWGENERSEDVDWAWTLKALQCVHGTLEEAAIMGITVFASAGDSGSDVDVRDKKAHVQYPASDPYVTGCGGTTVWNVRGPDFVELTWLFTGGGISDIFRPPNFPLPVWQSLARLPGSVNDGHNGRGVPDIAGNADGCSGYYFGGTITEAGTSATAPLYAALAAQLNANLGEAIGYLNPFLYAGPDYVFRDIRDGQSNAHGGAKGYVAGPGWDGCTGLGRVDGTALKYALLGGGPDALLPLLLGG